MELDVRCQALMEKALRERFPEVALLGEEGVAGHTGAAYRWVVDPIDGTVNFAYGIPHACVSIALQRRNPSPRAAEYGDGYDTLVGETGVVKCFNPNPYRGAPCLNLNKRTDQSANTPEFNLAYKVDEERMVYTRIPRASVPAA